MPILLLKVKDNNKKRIKNNKKTTIIFIFLLVLLSFLLIINISDIFSSVIANKNGLFYQTKIELPSYSVYAVSVYDFQNGEESLNFSQKVKEQGGCGYVYQKGEYFVFANCYPSLMEAKEIQANLKVLGYNSRIVNIRIDSISKQYKGENAYLIQESINYFRQVFLKLYQATISFDKQLSNQNQINSIIANLLTNLSSLQNKLEKLKTNEDKGLKNIILPQFESCKKQLEETLFFIGDDFEYTSKLKNLFLTLALKNQQIVKDINNL